MRPKDLPSNPAIPVKAARILPLPRPGGEGLPRGSYDGVRWRWGAGKGLSGGGVSTAFEYDSGAQREDEALYFVFLSLTCI